MQTQMKWPAVHTTLKKCIKDHERLVYSFLIFIGMRSCITHKT